jgi:hypothetical protein
VSGPALSIGHRKGWLYPADETSPTASIVGPLVPRSITVHGKKIRHEFPGSGGDDDRRHRYAAVVAVLQAEHTQRRRAPDSAETHGERGRGEVALNTGVADVLCESAFALDGHFKHRTWPAIWTDRRIDHTRKGEARIDAIIKQLGLARQDHRTGYLVVGACNHLIKWPVIVFCQPAVRHDSATSVTRRRKLGT